MAEQNVGAESTLDPGQQYVLVLSGYEVLTIAGLLLSTADQARDQGSAEAFDLLTDLGVKVIQQADPDGWAAAEEEHKG